MPLLGSPKFLRLRCEVSCLKALLRRSSANVRREWPAGMEHLQISVWVPVGILYRVSMLLHGRTLKDTSQEQQATGSSRGESSCQFSAVKQRTGGSKNTQTPLNHVFQLAVMALRSRAFQRPVGPFLSQHPLLFPLPMSADSSDGEVSVGNMHRDAGDSNEQSRNGLQRQLCGDIFYVVPTS